MVRGAGVAGNDYKFNGLELVTDKREYAPGDKVKLLVNTDTIDGTVLLFLRPTNGIYLAPKVIRLEGKSVVEEVAVIQKDMPNFFIEAMTVHGGKIHQEMREVVVPPEKRVLNVEVLPSAQEYKPGEKATVKVKVTDFFGKPFAGTTVMSVYDRSVEYISGGSNVPEIREFFWKWRRSHQPQNENSLARGSGNLLKPNSRPACRTWASSATRSSRSSVPSATARAALTVRAWSASPAAAARKVSASSPARRMRPCRRGHDEVDRDGRTVLRRGRGSRSSTRRVLGETRKQGVERGRGRAGRRRGMPSPASSRRCAGTSPTRRSGRAGSRPATTASPRSASPCPSS